MGQYTPGSTIVNGAVIDATAITAELAAIQAAHNAHATTDFTDATITNQKLVNSYFYFTMQLSIAAATGAVTSTAQIPIPMACTVAGVRVTADALTGTIPINVLQGGAAGTTILAASQELTGATATNSTALTIASSGLALTSGSNLWLTLAVGGGESFSGLTVTVLCKAQLSS